MKTLLITPDLFGTEGGIARIMRLYLRALSDLAGPGDSVEYCTLLDRGDTSARAKEFGGAALRGFRNCQGSRLWFTASVLRRAQEADLIVCGHVHFLPLARLACLTRPALRYCLVAHGIEVWRPYSLLEKAALRGATRIFCVSEYTRRQMLRFDPRLDPARLVVVPNTFDPQFRPPVATATAAASPGARRFPRVLTVSRLVSSDPYKGVDTLIEAMPEIRRRFPDAELRIVGGGNDQPRLEQLAQQGGVADDAVTFLGAVNDARLREEYEGCDLFALPSRKEGFGLVYLEALSYGKPCLAARAGGAPEVVTDEVGALIDYGNTGQIAAAVSDLINFPRARDALLARAARYSFPNFKARLASFL